jgi:two-component system response regulator YesN
MLKLLIADDEKYERTSIINILESSLDGQLNISEAKNGREAIEISESIRPDIVIMDIKMPGINGLKAIQEIRKFIPNVYIIILSAYDYFDFAVEAVKNNVKEYILKPFTKKEIIEKIRQAIDFVLIEKEKRQNEIENQEKIYSLTSILENELSYSIINNLVESIDSETYMKYIDMDFKNAFSIIVRVKEKNNYENVGGKSYKELKPQIGDYIKEYLNRKYRTIASYKFTEDMVYFIQYNNFEDEGEIKFNIINVAVDIKRKIKRHFDVSIKVGIGRCYKGLHQMYKSYKEAYDSVEYESQNNRIVHFDDINHNSRENKFNDQEIKSIDREKIALFKSVEQYITDNLKEDLDLEKVAAKFNLSSFYFSRMFKEVVGYNFSDYINMIRIGKSKKLLKSQSITIKETCYNVGYSDPNYFSKVFKKYEGISPTEFKTNIK